jgi:hypothetical protein
MKMRGGRGRPCMHDARIMSVSGQRIFPQIVPGCASETKPRLLPTYEWGVST